MVTAAKTDREFCAGCGWPLKGMRCEACGAERMNLELRDATAAEVVREPSFGDANDKAVESFKKQEWTRFVGFTVTAEGGASARTVATDDGPGWIATIEGAVIFVTLALVGQEVTIEAPVVRVPREKRVAVLRSALEGLARAGELSHACLRDDLVLLRTRVRLGSASPALLRRALRETARAAEQSIEMLGASFLARPAIPPSDRGHVGFEALGAPRRLAKAIAESAPIASLASGPAKSTPIGVRVPPLALGAAPAPPSIPEPPSAPDKRPAVEEDDDDGLPAILAPMLLTRKKPSVPPPGPSAPEPSPAAPVRKSVPPPMPRPAARAPVSGQPSIPISVGGPGGPAVPARDVVRAFVDDRKNPAPGPRMNGGRMATLELEAVGPDLEPTHRKQSPSGEIAILPVDRFCALLKRGQLLVGGALGNGVTNVSWIVRAAVFRAVYEFRDALPDAVAHLYRAAGVSAKSGTAQDPEAAIAVFEKLIEAQANVPKEKPLSVEALTSAQQAKDHVARYIAEIERSPNDPGLRHYLALGSLSELLVRAKLPAQTGQRLRDIISHAQREGAKPAAIDLLMTALKRISA